MLTGSAPGALNYSFCKYNYFLVFVFQLYVLSLLIALVGINMKKIK